MTGRRRLIPSCRHLLLSTALLLVIDGCDSNRIPAESAGTPNPLYRTFSRAMMGTTIQATLPESDRDSLLAEAVFEQFRLVDERMSEWKETSPLSAVNRLAGAEAAPVPDDLREVVRRGLEFGDRTNGAFDITWAALWGLWNFRADHPTPPDDFAIEERVALVDYRAVSIDDDAGTIRLPRKGMKIGLGGIAKGYALDRSVAALRAMGIDSFLLSAGGQVYAEGEKGNRPWKVGIQDPRRERGEYFALVRVSGLSVSTSGDYESYFIDKGIRYHHILDPRTGRPSDGPRSVTVISTDATLADALSTSIMVMGRDAGLDLVESMAGVEAVVVGRNGHLYSSSGAAPMLDVLHPPDP